jgi:L-fuconolactonase
MTIDAHFHCWQLSRGDYSWLTPALAPIYRNVTVLDWQLQARPQGVAGGILVQAAPTEDETMFLLQQADKNPAVLGVVGWVDLTAPDAARRIEALAQHPSLKGLRPMLHDLDDPQWILQPALAPALQAMVDGGLVFDALVKPVHLPHILTLALRYPQLRLVIDHCAKPDIAAGQWQPWADQMAQLASQTNAYCKLSGLLTEAGHAAAKGAVQRWAGHVLACFGADRVVWGSDWPVLELAGTYTMWLDETRQILSHLNATQAAAVMGENARQLYRI